MGGGGLRRGLGGGGVWGGGKEGVGGGGTLQLVNYSSDGSREGRSKT